MAVRSTSVPSWRVSTLPAPRSWSNTIVRLMKLFTPMVPHQQAYVIGNEALGIWSSPALELVYEAPHARPPIAGDGEDRLAARKPPPGPAAAAVR